MDALTVDHLAETLQEPNRLLLRQVLRHLGQDRATTVLAEALAREANGGMVTKDGTRRRTPGGTFFQLVKEQVTSRERWQLFAPKGRRPIRKPLRKAEPPGLPGAAVASLIQVIKPYPAGEAYRMKLTLIGRPGKVATRDQVVVFRMQGKPPTSLPRGFPPLPKTPGLTWNVMVALRQWNRVKDCLATDKDDQLIVEGYPLMQDNQHVLLAQSCTSVALQRAQKAATQQETTP
jgi:PHAX RNA-binding domain